MAHISKVGKSWRVQTYYNGQRASRTFKTESLANAFAETDGTMVKGIVEQKALLKDHRIINYLPKRFLDAVEKANYSADEIVQSAMPAINNIGVYFLIRRLEIKYVGQTINIFHRIDQHRRSGKVFDAYSFIPCAVDDLNELERTYRDLLMPDENKY